MSKANWWEEVSFQAAFLKVEFNTAATEELLITLLSKHAYFIQIYY